MTDIYDRARALALRMLAPRAKGGKGLMAVLAVAADDPVYTPGQPVTPGETRLNVSMVRTEFTTQEIDGTNILAGDVRFLLSPEDANGVNVPKPKSGDAVEFDGVRYSVVASKAWNYAGLDCGFVAQGRPA